MRRGWAKWTSMPEQAREFFVFLVRQVVRMLCLGMIHGDLSEYNVLVDAHGPVIIDLPQAVSAAGNNNARAMLLRDVNKIRSTLALFAPELDGLHLRRGDVGAVREGRVAARDRSSPASSISARTRPTWTPC